MPNSEYEKPGGYGVFLQNSREVATDPIRKHGDIASRSLHRWNHLAGCFAAQGHGGLFSQTARQPFVLAFGETRFPAYTPLSIHLILWRRLWLSKDTTL